MSKLVVGAVVTPYRKSKWPGWMEDGMTNSIGKEYTIVGITPSGRYQLDNGFIYPKSTLKFIRK